MIALKRASKGVTLIELIIVLTILAVLSSIAFPSLNNLRQSAISRSARSDLTVAISQARSSAIMKQRRVVACPSSDLDQCAHSVDWHHGWMVFVDDNRDRKRDADEQIVAVGQALPNGVAIVGSRGRYQVSFQPDGTADGSNLTFTVCDRRGPAHASSLVMNNAGRLRKGTPSPAQAQTACAAI
ncbi:MAG: prepilin-type N-terminal cleavage/methylation domain-containing protein [Gammaproteobacteria bacterium]|nr:MAG: prepilin-type N-terminal cleavage/methylation domain-containing protein [Gammaproteobacteria bacterium]